MSIVIPLVAIIALVIIHELGHFFAAKLVGVKVLEFSVGFPPRILSTNFRGTKFSFGALLLGGFVKLKGDGAEAEDTSKDSLSGTTTGRKLIILIAGVVMNLLAAWFLFALLFTRGVSLPAESLPQNLRAEFQSNTPTLSFFEVAPDSPADLANVPTKKKVTQVVVQDNVIANPTQEMFGQIVQVGEPLTISFEDVKDPVTVTPMMNNGKYRVGVVLLEDIRVQENFISAVGHSLSYTAFLTKSTFMGFVHAVVNVVTPDEPGVSTSGDASVSGPIGIVRILGNTLAEGFSLFLVLVAIISINLAVLNILPLPILDGGRILIVLFEAARGRKISMNAQAILNGIGMLIILGLAVVGVINDLAK